ncbi:MAG: helix-turn-helix domain-containing protein [Pyrinomonadaceae bacterium]
MSTHFHASSPTRQPLLKVNDVARLLNVKPRTIYEMVAQHRIPFRKPPGTNILLRLNDSRVRDSQLKPSMKHSERQLRLIENSNYFLEYSH